MSITAVQEGAGNTTDGGTTVSYTFGSNVTAGNLIVVGYGGYRGTTNDPPVVGDISKSAGTATVGAFSMDGVCNYNHEGTNYIGGALYSAIVTGSGSCTIQIAGAPAGSYVWTGVTELNASNGWDASRVEMANNNQSGASGGPDAGSLTSVGGAYMAAVCATNTSSNTAHTEDAAWTLVYEVEDGSVHGTGAFIRRIVTVGTTDNGNWTAPTTVQWTACGAVYKEAAGASSILEDSDWYQPLSAKELPIVSVW